MSSSVPPPLLSSGAKPSRSASAVVANKAQGFHVFRIDGYSVTTNLPGGERITSDPFVVGGRTWHVDFYPNGTDASRDDSDSVALYLRLAGSHKRERVRAEYKFSLLDHAGVAAYELPKEKAVFTAAAHVYGGGAQLVEEADPGRGYACFITKDELGKRGEKLLRDDTLAIRCDVGVAEVTTLDIAPQGSMRGVRPIMRGRGGRVMSLRGGYYDGGGFESPDEMDGEYEGRRSQPPPTDDKEYIHRCLTAHRRKH